MTIIHMSVHFVCHINIMVEEEGEGGVADPSLTDQDLHQLVVKLATDTGVQGPGSFRYLDFDNRSLCELVR